MGRNDGVRRVCAGPIVDRRFVGQGEWRWACGAGRLSVPRIRIRSFFCDANPLLLSTVRTWSLAPWNSPSLDPPSRCCSTPAGPRPCSTTSASSRASSRRARCGVGGELAATLVTDPCFLAPHGPPLTPSPPPPPPPPPSPCAAIRSASSNNSSRAASWWACAAMVATTVVRCALRTRAWPCPRPRPAWCPRSPPKTRG